MIDPCTKGDCWRFEGILWKVSNWATRIAKLHLEQIYEDEPSKCGINLNTSGEGDVQDKGASLKESAFRTNMVKIKLLKAPIAQWTERYFWSLIKENLGLVTGFSEVRAALAICPNLEAIKDVLKQHNRNLHNYFTHHDHKDCHNHDMKNYLLFSLQYLQWQSTFLT